MKKNIWKNKHITLSNSKSERQLIVNKDILLKTHESFQKYMIEQNESIIYWYGIESFKENKDYVTCVVAPKAKRTPRNYFVTANDAAKMGKKMIEMGWICLAQFHTHPRKDTEHSDYDDEHTISTRNGFLSLVAPEYGNYSPLNFEEISIHESWDNVWDILDDPTKLTRIHVIDSFVNFEIGDNK